MGHKEEMGKIFGEIKAEAIKSIKKDLRKSVEKWEKDFPRPSILHPFQRRYWRKSEEHFLFQEENDLSCSCAEKIREEYEKYQHEFGEWQPGRYGHGLFDVRKCSCGYTQYRLPAETAEQECKFLSIDDIASDIGLIKLEEFIVRVKPGLKKEYLETE